MSEAARATVRGFGARTGFDDARGDLLDAVTEVTEDGFDVILDHRVGGHCQIDIDATAFGGRIVCYSGTSVA